MKISSSYSHELESTPRNSGDSGNDFKDFKCSDDCNVDDETTNVKRTALDAIRQLTGSKNGPTFAGAYRWDPFDPQCSKCEFFPFDCSDAYNQASIFRPACGKHVSRPTALDTNTKRLEESQHPPVSPWNPDRQANSSEILQPQTVTSVTPHSHEKLPCEIFRLVAKYLSFSDITNLRLVDKSFERVVSTCLFHTVFIPFNTEIYGSLSMQEQQLLAQAQECDGATKPKTLPSVESERLGADSLRHRMRDLDMFGGFGSHVHCFGINFDASENDLMIARTSNDWCEERTFWGNHIWPTRRYCRFQDRSCLELTADKTTTMKKAFKYLQNVRHLALSISSGLGWIAGPDLSIRGRVLRQCPHPLPDFEFVTEPATQLRRQLWRAISKAYVQDSNLESLKMAELARIEKEDLSSLLPLAAREPMRIEKTVVRGATFPSGTSKSSEVANSHDSHRIGPSLETNPGEPSSGVLFARHISTLRNVQTELGPVKPKDLSESQERWLMETSWAQTAFLSSYIISIVDNNAISQSVTTLTLSPFSSGYLTHLRRKSFWDTLTSLTSLELMVNPDWRDIKCNESGSAITFMKLPTAAVDALYELLQTFIAPRVSIAKLKVGWAAGGEHNEGLIARNRHLMPAPLTRRGSCLPRSIQGVPLLKLPYVKQFNLVNCWVAPNVLQDWVRCHLSYETQRVVLESVSLTAHPKYPRRGQDQVPNAVDADVNNVNDHNNAAVWHQTIPQNLNTQNHVNAPFQNGLLQFQQHALQAYQTWIAQQPGYAAHIGFNPQIGHVMNTAHGAGGVPNNFGNFNHETHPRDCRPGSWPSLLSVLKALIEARGRGALQLTLLSCGLATLPTSSFDQSAIEELWAPSREESNWFRARREALQGVLMQSFDDLHGKVATRLPPFEEALLMDKWNLKRGWPGEQSIGDDYSDEDGWGKWGSKNEEAATYDGQPPGGTGRMSGTIAFTAEGVGKEDKWDHGRV